MMPMQVDDVIREKDTGDLYIVTDLHVSTNPWKVRLLKGGTFDEFHDISKNLMNLLFEPYDAKYFRHHKDGTEIPPPFGYGAVRDTIEELRKLDEAYLNMREKG